jgi:hypothetical protein
MSESIPTSYKHDDVNTRLHERGEDEGKQCEDEVHDGGEGEDMDESDYMRRTSSLYPTPLAKLVQPWLLGLFKAKVRLPQGRGR